MSSLVNVWLAMSATATNAIRTRLQWNAEEQGEYTGPVTDTEYRIFLKMADFVTVERMFKRPIIDGKRRHLFTLNFAATAKARTALEYIEANRPGHFNIAGAWWWDSRQIGTQWELDAEGNRTGNTTGTPLYPLHARLLDFMPDIVEHDSDGNIISTTAATVLVDVNLVQGQEPRRFT